jgi:hypothetical protein
MSFESFLAFVGLAILNQLTCFVIDQYNSIVSAILLFVNSGLLLFVSKIWKRQYAVKKAKRSAIRESALKRFLEET